MSKYDCSVNWYGDQPAARSRYTAAICRRGHLIEGMLNAHRTQAPGPRCQDCGATVLTACPNCAAPLLGYSTGALVFSFTPDNFCTDCGKPYPWAGREAIIFHLENELQERDDLDEASRLEVIEQLAVLAAPSTASVKENDRINAGIRIKALAPKAWSFATPVFQSILSLEVQRRLGLPTA